MDNLKKTDTIGALLFCNSEGVTPPPETMRKTFPLPISSKEYRQLRYELQNKDILVQLDISMNGDERKSDEDNSSLYFEARGKRFLKTSAVLVKPLSFHISRDYFRSICEANSDPNVIACIGVVGASSRLQT